MASTLPMTLRFYRSLSLAAAPLAPALIKQRLRHGKEDPERIGEGRAISEKFRNDMQTSGKRDGTGSTARPFGCHIGQQHRQRNTGALSNILCLAGGRMKGEQLVDCRARSTLAALVQPEPGNHRGIVGTPDARHEGRLRCRCHRARGCAEDIGEIGLRPATDPDSADPAGMRIDKTGRNRRPGE